mgnify:CR=1 FL=1
MDALRSLSRDLSIFSDGGTSLVNASCKEALKAMPGESVALVITDPPYGGHTHNQQAWDVAWSDEEWKEILREVFRVLLPGGHMVVFSSGKSTLKINASIIGGHKTLFKKEPSYYPMVWVHNSQDSGRVHQHLPRSQFESIHVYYREGEGKIMDKAGTFSKSYAHDQHVGRHNVFRFDKDDCRKKPFPTVQAFFESASASGKHLSTFDYKPEGLMRALIRDYTKPGHVVMDICMRHGITAVACKMENRQCVGIEIDESAYHIAVNRFKDQFGSSPSFDCMTPEPTSRTPAPISPCHPVLDGSPIAKKDALLEPVPTHPRPRGRAPKGSTWSFDTGAWVKGRAIDKKPADRKGSKAKTKPACGTPGCKLFAGHIGLCSCAVVQGKRPRF